MKKILLSTAGLLFLSSCQSYKKIDLQPQEILSRLESQRVFEGNKSHLTLARAEQLMDQNNLELKRLRRAYKAMSELAALKTPLSNPSLEFGPAFGSKLDETTASATQGFIGLGFRFPLGPRLRRNDDLNQLKALEAYNEEVLKHREIAGELRRSYIALALTQRSRKLQESLMKTLSLNEEMAIKLFKIGSLNKLGVSATRLQQAELKLSTIDQEIEFEEALSGLSELLVRDLRQHSLEMPILNLNTSSLADLKQKILLDNPSLARAEMSFHLADAKLRLALAKQYPDLNIGFSAEREVGEKTRSYILPISLDLPIFDRNQQGIVASVSRRDEALLRYKETLNRQLTNVEKAFHQLKLSSRKLTMMKNDLLPMSRRNLQDARKSLELGSIDILRYFDLLASHQRLKQQALALEEETWNYQITLEQLCGIPNSMSVKNKLKKPEQK